MRLFGGVQGESVGGKRTEKLAGAPRWTHKQTASSSRIRRCENATPFPAFTIRDHSFRDLLVGGRGWLGWRLVGLGCLGFQLGESLLQLSTQTRLELLELGLGRRNAPDIRHEQVHPVDPLGTLLLLVDAPVAILDKFEPNK